MRDVVAAIVGEIVELAPGSNTQDNTSRIHPTWYVDLGKRRVIVAPQEDASRPLEVRLCSKYGNSHVYKRACVMNIEIANQSSMDHTIELAAKWLMSDHIVTAIGCHLKSELSDLPGCSIDTFSTREGTFTTISLETRGIDIEHRFERLSVNFHDWSISAIGANKQYCILEQGSIEQMTTDIKEHFGNGR